MKRLLLILILSPIAHAGLLGSWILNKKNFTDQKFNPAGEAQEAPEFDTDGNLVFSSKQHVLLPEESAKKLPLENFAIEARVRIDQVQKWGSILSYSQDNGSYERGWILGYNGSRFSFRLSTGGRLLEVCLLYTSPSPRDRTRSRMPSSA